MPPEHMDIPVFSNDTGFFKHNPRNVKRLAFKRSAGSRSYGEQTVLNTVSSFLDLSAVYGDNDQRARALRTMEDGKLKTSKGDNLPFNAMGLMNAPSPSKDFFVAGDFRANEHVGLTIVHVIWMREHNKICDSLKLDFPRWGDERLYQMARKINGAFFQKVVFEEFYPGSFAFPAQKYLFGSTNQKL